MSDRKIKTALISVTDKRGIVEFSRALSAYGVTILSTGGTAELLRQESINVRNVSDMTGFPEILNDRVKTLHPKVYGGILAIRANAEHQQQMVDNGLEYIDMVVVNLYQFQQTI